MPGLTGCYTKFLGNAIYRSGTGTICRSGTNAIGLGGHGKVDSVLSVYAAHNFYIRQTINFTSQPFGGP